MLRYVDVKIGPTLIGIHRGIRGDFVYTSRFALVGHFEVGMSNVKEESKSLLPIAVGHFTFSFS